MTQSTNETSIFEAIKQEKIREFKEYYTEIINKLSTFPSSLEHRIKAHHFLDSAYLWFKEGMECVQLNINVESLIPKPPMDLGDPIQAKEEIPPHSHLDTVAQ